MAKKRKPQESCTQEEGRQEEEEEVSSSSSARDGARLLAPRDRPSRQRESNTTRKSRSESNDPNGSNFCAAGTANRWNR